VSAIEEIEELNLKEVQYKKIARIFTAGSFPVTLYYRIKRSKLTTGFSSQSSLAPTAIVQPISIDYYRQLYKYIWHLLQISYKYKYKLLLHSKYFVQPIVLAVPCTDSKFLQYYCPLACYEAALE